MILGKRNSAGPTRPAAKYLIEGESLTVAQIAQRLGTVRDNAYYRLRKAQRQPGPVTWGKLEGMP